MKRTHRKTNSKIKKSKTLKKEYSLYNGDKWDNYRLGDVIYGHFICWNKVCLNKEIQDKVNRIPIIGLIQKMINLVI